MTNHRYYTLYRPPMPGGIPKNPVDVHEFQERTFIAEINRPAWGYVEYEHELTEEEIAEYELGYAEDKEDGLWVEEIF